jgi:hypothetical protein
MKNILLIIISLLTSFTGFAQYDNNNLKKYYNYRDRLTNNFMVVGDGFGKSIPLSSRKWDSWGIHTLKGGEDTYMLGVYIGVLGTEYKLNKKSLNSNKETIKELYFALKALNRLDYYAETHYYYGSRSRNGVSESEKMKPELNGFFIREDFPDNFLANNPSLNDNAIKPITVDNYGYVKGEGTVIEVNKFGFNDDDGKRRKEYTAMSQDHSLAILWGLLLAHQSLDYNISFDNKDFLDNESDIKKEIENIYKRIVEYFIKNNWIIKNPTGSKVKAGPNVWVFSKDIYRSYKSFGGQKKGMHIGGNLTAIPYNLGSNGWMNGRMQLMSQNLSGSNYYLWKRATTLGLETYFINYGMYVHNLSFSSDKITDLKKTSEFYLNTAPCSGPFYHDDGNKNYISKDIGLFGWATPNRTERELASQYFGVEHNGKWNHAQGNYNGLDYLLLHNLYYLNNFESLPHFKRPYDLKSCKVLCNKMNPKIKEKEIERAKKILKKSRKFKQKTLGIRNFFSFGKDIRTEDQKNCSAKCKQEFKNCKNYTKRRECKKSTKKCKNSVSGNKRQCKKDSKQTKNKCKSSCNGLKGKSKRKCKRKCRKQGRKNKRGCRKQARKDRKNCKTMNPECKKYCKKQKKNCKRTCKLDGKYYPVINKMEVFCKQ